MMKAKERRGVVQILAAIALGACVLLTPASVRAQLNVAGQLLVDLDAQGLTPGPLLSWTNAGSLGTAFTPVGDGGVAVSDPLVETVDGVQAVTFDGDDALRLDAVCPAEINGTDDWSIEVWVYNPAIADQETVVACWHRVGDGSGALLYGASTVYGAFGAWANDLGYATLPAAGAWHYIVLTNGGGIGGDINVYVDGALDNSRTMAVALREGADATAVFLGRSTNENNGLTSIANNGQYFSGSLAQVRIHTEALTAAQVLNNFGYSPPRPAEIQLTPGDAAWVQGLGPAAIDANLSLVDNATTWISATVTLTNRPDGALESLSAAAQGAIGPGDINYDSGTGVLTVAPAGGAPIGDFQDVLRGVAYDNAAVTFDATPRQISFAAVSFDSDVAGPELKTLQLALPQLVVAGELLVDLDAESLALGALATWANNGTLGTAFTPVGDGGAAVSDPQVETVGGFRAVTFDGDDAIRRTCWTTRRRIR